MENFEIVYVLNDKDQTSYQTEMESKDLNSLLDYLGNLDYFRVVKGFGNKAIMINHLHVKEIHVNKTTKIPLPDRLEVSDL